MGKASFKRGALICLGILCLSWLGLKVLASHRQPPVKTVATERALIVRTLVVQPGGHALTLKGYGMARALAVVTVAAQVSGNVVAIHPHLEQGRRVASGEMLFRLDAATFLAARQEADAQATALEKTCKRLQMQSELDRDRLKLLRRNRVLAQARYQRVKQLFDDHAVGTRSGVEAAEMEANRAFDDEQRLAASVALLPLEQDETRSRLAASRAALSAARENIRRCTVIAPCAGRLIQADLEPGEYVRAGETVLQIEDDRRFEIRVCIDIETARRWLPKSAQGAGHSPDESLPPVPCRIFPNGNEAAALAGRLHRVVGFNRKTRTLEIAVRTAADTTLLMDGMHCRVDIPGRIHTPVFLLPAAAVAFDRTVHLAVGNRLKSVAVSVIGSSGDHVIVGSGLAAGDEVIVTPLAYPAENALLERLGGKHLMGAD